MILQREMIFMRRTNSVKETLVCNTYVNLLADRYRIPFGNFHLIGGAMYKVGKNKLKEVLIKVYSCSTNILCWFTYFLKAEVELLYCNNNLPTLHICFLYFYL